MGRETPVREITLVKLIEKLELLERLNLHLPPTKYAFYDVNVGTTPVELLLPDKTKSILILNDGGSPVYAQLTEGGEWIRIENKETFSIDFQTTKIALKTQGGVTNVRVTVCW